MTTATELEQAQQAMNDEITAAVETFLAAIPEARFHSGNIYVDMMDGNSTVRTTTSVEAVINGGRITRTYPSN
ncbi:hypothetical protein JYB87_11790 [Shewanella avicenniae]|uniref:Uncharacterized protein n=1 Tax=Shewanella avicenniae TaxID=2814294 RepID=A0ABX7QLX2_9GAMM|nr:hypothetical protein [Shewanella avicenniae]QSX32448.1 hypothetical protein JYB87_11790 [Shewanella avicenniae]